MLLYLILNDLIYKEIGASMIIGFRSSRNKWYAIDTINNIGIIYKRIGASNNVTSNQLRQGNIKRH